MMAHESKSKYTGFLLRAPKRSFLREDLDGPRDWIGLPNRHLL